MEEMARGKKGSVRGKGQWEERIRERTDPWERTDRTTSVLGPSLIRAFPSYGLEIGKHPWEKSLIGGKG